MVDVLVFRSESAWALPRPSANASANSANRTVNHSQSEIWTMNPFDSPLVFAKMAAVVMTAHISVTNMTGFFIRDAGFSFFTESLRAWRRSFFWKIP